MKRHGVTDWWLYAVLWCLCWVFSQVWFRFRYAGRANVPITGPVLLVSNHQSHLDPLLIGIASPRQTRALARHDLFFWPLDWLIRSLGAVPIDRDRGALGGIRATLKMLNDGEAVQVYPEGSRTFDGQLQQFLPGFCMLARRSGATIVPVAIDGAHAAMPRGSGFPRPKAIRLTFGPPITKEQYAGQTDAQLAELVRRRIAEGLADGRISAQPD